MPEYNKKISPVKIPNKKSYLNKIYSDTDTDTVTDPYFRDKFKKYKTQLNSKYITCLIPEYITNLKYVQSPYFCTYDLETFKNSKGIATPYLFGIYIPNIGFKAFYG